MSPERQRVVIAELCGFETDMLNTCHCGQIATGNRCDNHSPVPMMSLGDLPDYLNDLNAMHEAERIFLTNQLGPAYQNWLNRLNAEDMEFGVYHVTAAQRAEALLRTLNKWEDAK